MPSRTFLALLMSGVFALGISACGSSSSNSSTTAAAGAGAGASGGTSTSSSTARYQARLNLAKCFRAHGLNVPDPSQNGGPAGGGGGGIFRSLQGYSRTQVQAATQACSQYMRQAFAFGNISPAQQQAFRQDFVKYAECMRSHGVNMADPSTTTGGGFGLRDVLTPAVRNSPNFQSANTACQSLRPRFGRGAGARGAGGAPGA